MMKVEVTLKMNMREPVLKKVEKFKRKDLLKKHTVTHISSAKLSCEHCGKLYGRKDHLSQHVKLHHLNPERYHSCEICGKKFKEKSSLKRHKMSQHNI